MRKFIPIVIALQFITIIIQAQQDAHYTLFMYNNMLNNAGFTGSRRITSVTALYRNQWIGFEGNPQSYSLSVDAPIGNKRLGSGLVLVNQNEGIIRRFNSNLSLSYDIINSKTQSFRIGLNASVRQYRFDLQNPDIYIRERIDPALNYEKPTLTNANVGIGLYYDNQNFYCGISVPHLNKNPITLRSDAVTKDFIGTEHRHFYFMGGGLIPLISEKLIFKPSMLFKYVENAPWSCDLNASVMVNKRFTGGFAYRFGGSGGKGDSIDFLGFVQATDNLGIGFAYDFTLSQINAYNQGTLEAVMRYDFGKSRQILHNPRFFF